MSVSTVRGIRTTDLVSSSLIKRDVFEAIYNFKPYQTPIMQFFMANKFAKLRCGNPKFEIQEDVLMPYSDTLGAAIAGGSTTEALTMTTGAYWKVNDIMRNIEKDENYRVTAVSSNTVTVAMVGSGNMTATANGSTMLNIGYAAKEGDTAAQFLSTVSTFPYNYAQIFRKTVNLSGTQAATENYGGDDWLNQRMKSTEEFKLDIERDFVYGVRYLITTAGANVWFTGGLLDSAGMGISDVSQFVGVDFCTEDFFFGTYCKNLFAKGAREKTLYCGSTALEGINDFSKVKQKTQVDEDEYGVDIQFIKTPFGRLRLVWHPLLEGTSTASGGYSNYGIGIDRDEYLKYRFLSANGASRDMSYNSDIHTPGTDERKAEYLAQIGLHLAGGGQGYHRVLKGGASA